eukprot:TRINITY_DN27242_c0_g1_i1.p1 TRINITY_DN27242_c0_g1~~TRINITY_DN27242_c0_g1_i1.p1  ORF type:complete len:2972 (+),score=468.19 TRINITY_DN27242_c0_g1_i1:2175-11090(+)
MRLFYSLVQAAIQYNHKDVVQDFDRLLKEAVDGAFDTPADPLEEADENRIDEESSDDDDLGNDHAVSRRTLNQASRKTGDSKNNTGNAKRSKPKKGKRVGFVAEFLNFVDREGAGLTLLHVAAQFALIRKDKGMVGLVAQMLDAGVLYVINANRQSPLSLALKVKPSGDAETASEWTEDMIGQGCEEEKNLIKLLTFCDFECRAVEARAQSSQSVLQDMHGEMTAYFDSVQMANELMEDLITRRVDVKDEPKTVLHLIGEYALVQDFKFICQELPSKGRRIADLFRLCDVRGWTMVHHIAAGIEGTAVRGKMQSAGKSVDVEQLMDSRSQSRPSSAGALSMGGASHQTQSPQKGRHLALWHEVLHFCQKDEVSMNGGMIQKLLEILALTDKESKLLEKFAPLNRLCEDSRIQDMGISRQQIARIFQTEAMKSSDIDSLLTRFGSGTWVKHDVIFGWGSLFDKTPENPKPAVTALHVPLGKERLVDNWDCDRQINIDVGFVRNISGIMYQATFDDGDSEMGKEHRRIKVKIMFKNPGSDWESPAHSDDLTLVVRSSGKSATPAKGGVADIAEADAGADQITDHTLHFSHNDELAEEQLEDLLMWQKGTYARARWIRVEPSSDGIKQTFKIRIYPKLLEHIEDVGMPMKPIADLPGRMLEMVASHSQNLEDISLLQWCAKREHYRSCWKLIRSDIQYGRCKGSTGATGGKTPLEQTNPDSELYAELFVNHVSFLCNEAIDGLSELRDSAGSLDIIVGHTFREMVDQQLRMISDQLGKDKLFSRRSFIKYATKAGFSTHQVGQLVDKLDELIAGQTAENTGPHKTGETPDHEEKDNQNDIPARVWTKCYEELKQDLLKLSDCFFQSTERNANFWKTSDFRLSFEDAKVLRSKLQEEFRGSAVIDEEAFVHIVDQMPGLFKKGKVLYTVLCGQGSEASNAVRRNTVLEALSQMIDAAKSYYISMDYLNKVLQELDDKVLKLFNDAGHGQRQRICEECCNWQEKNYTLFHYAAMYGLKQTLARVLDVAKLYRTHMFERDKENKTFMGVLCSKLSMLFPELRVDIEERRIEMQSASKTPMDDRFRQRLRNVQERDAVKFENVGLHAAATAGNMHLVKHIIKNLGQGIDAVDKVDETGADTALHCACREGSEKSLQVVEYLLSMNANADKQDSSGQTCFHIVVDGFASKVGNSMLEERKLFLKLLETLITSSTQKHSWQDVRNHKKRTVIAMVATMDAPELETELHKDLFTKVLNAYGEINTYNDLLQAACQHGNYLFLEGVRESFPAGRKARLKDACVSRTGQNQSLLHLCAGSAKKGTKVIEQLKTMCDSCGDDRTFLELMTTKDDNQNTPLHVAAQSKNFDVMAYFTKTFREGKAQDQNDNTFEKWLNHCNLNGKSALQICDTLTDCNLKEAAEALYCKDLLHIDTLTSDLKKHVETLQGNLHVVIEEDKDDNPTSAKHAGIVDLVRKQKDLLRVKKTPEQTAGIYSESCECEPLHVAVSLMRKNWVIFLLDEHADVDARDGQDRTPLHIAFLRAGGPEIDDALTWKRSQDLARGDSVFAFEGPIDMCPAVISKHTDIPDPKTQGAVYVDWDDNYSMYRDQQRDWIIRVKDYFEHVSKVAELLMEQLVLKRKLNECLNHVCKANSTPLDAFWIQAKRRYWSAGRRYEFLLSGFVSFVRAHQDIVTSKLKLFQQPERHDIPPKNAMLHLCLECMDGCSFSSTRRELLDSAATFVADLVDKAEDLDEDEPVIQLLENVQKSDLKALLYKRILSLRLDKVASSDVACRVDAVIPGLKLKQNLIELAVQYGTADQIGQALRCGANVFPNPLAGFVAGAAYDSAPLEIYAPDSTAIRFTLKQQWSGGQSRLFFEEIKSGSSPAEVTHLWLDKRAFTILCVLKDTDESEARRFETPMPTYLAGEISRKLGKWGKRLRPCKLSSVSSSEHGLSYMALRRGNSDILEKVISMLSPSQDLNDRAWSTVESGDPGLAFRQADMMKYLNIEVTRATMKNTILKDWRDRGHQVLTIMHRWRDEAHQNDPEVKVEDRAQGAVICPGGEQWQSYQLGWPCRVDKRTYYEVRLVRPGVGLRVGLIEDGHGPNSKSWAVDSDGYIFGSSDPDHEVRTLRRSKTQRFGESSQNNYCEVKLAATTGNSSHEVLVDWHRNLVSNDADKVAHFKFTLQMSMDVPDQQSTSAGSIPINSLVTLNHEGEPCTAVLKSREGDSSSCMVETLDGKNPKTSVKLDGEAIDGMKALTEKVQFLTIKKNSKTDDEATGNLHFKFVYINNKVGKSSQSDFKQQWEAHRISVTCLGGAGSSSQHIQMSHEHALSLKCHLVMGSNWGKLYLLDGSSESDYGDAAILLELSFEHSLSSWSSDPSDLITYPACGGFGLHFQAVCNRGHGLVKNPRPGNRCDVCGNSGTEFRCPSGCDYDMCLSCHRTRTQGLKATDTKHSIQEKGSASVCSQHNVCLDKRKSEELPWKEVACEECSRVDVDMWVCPLWREHMDEEQGRFFAVATCSECFAARKRHSCPEPSSEDLAQEARIFVDGCPERGTFETQHKNLTTIEVTADDATTGHSDLEGTYIQQAGGSAASATYVQKEASADAHYVIKKSSEGWSIFKSTSASGEAASTDSKPAEPDEDSKILVASGNPDKPNPWDAEWSEVKVQKTGSLHRMKFVCKAAIDTSAALHFQFREDYSAVPLRSSTSTYPTCDCGEPLLGKSTLHCKAKECSNSECQGSLHTYQLYYCCSKESCDETRNYCHKCFSQKLAYKSDEKSDFSDLPEESQVVRSAQKDIWCAERSWLQGDVLCVAVDRTDANSHTMKIAVNGLWDSDGREYPDTMVVELPRQGDLFPVFYGAAFEHAFGSMNREWLYGPPAGKGWCSLTQLSRRPTSTDYVQKQEKQEESEGTGEGLPQSASEQEGSSRLSEQSRQSSASRQRGGVDHAQGLPSAPSASDFLLYGNPQGNGQALRRGRSSSRR